MASIPSILVGDTKTDKSCPGKAKAMPQISLYIPTELEKKVRKSAKLRGKSLSAYVTEVLSERVEPRKWSKDFFKTVVGGWKGEFPSIERPPPQDEDSL
jgi:hypothetical protein